MYAKKFNLKREKQINKKIKLIEDLNKLFWYLFPEKKNLIKAALYSKVVQHSYLHNTMESIENRACNDLHAFNTPK